MIEDTFACYKILDVEPGASAERIRHSYVELARVWDPVRYIDNPELRTRAEKKRKEIDEAYQAIRAFLPELQGPIADRQRTDESARDFKEMERVTAVETTRAVMGILVAVALLLVFAWAFYLLMKGRTMTPSAIPLE